MSIIIEPRRINIFGHKGRGDLQIIMPSRTYTITELDNIDDKLIDELRRYVLALLINETGWFKSEGWKKHAYAGVSLHVSTVDNPNDIVNTMIEQFGKAASYVYQHYKDGCFKIIGRRVEPRDKRVYLKVGATEHSAMIDFIFLRILFKSVELKATYKFRNDVDSVKASINFYQGRGAAPALPSYITSLIRRMKQIT
jgi:hypothetical protein